MRRIVAGALIAALLWIGGATDAVVSARTAASGGRLQPASVRGIPPIPVASRGAPASLRPLFDPRLPPGGAPTDAATRLVVQDYRAARLFDPRGAARMFVDAWSSLHVPRDPQVRAALRDLETLLFTQQLWYRDNAYSTDSTDAIAQRLQQDTSLVFPALQKDEANAALLADAGVALEFIGYGELQGTPITSVDGIGVSDAHSSVEPGLNEGLNGLFYLAQQAAKLFPNAPSLAVSPIAARLAQAAQVANRQGIGQPLNVAAGIRDLAPLLAGRQTAPLGHAAIGDLYLEKAHGETDSAPYTARHDARLALDQYDTALAGTTDPSAYAGRAAALELLGDFPDAAASQQIAVRRVPTSIDYLGTLLWYQAEAGDMAGVRASAAQLLALLQQGWDPAIPDVRVLPAGNGGNDGTAFQTFFLPSRVYNVSMPYGAYESFITGYCWQCGGGGGLILLNLIPKYDQATIKEERWGDSSFTQALRAVLVGHILTADAVPNSLLQKDAPLVAQYDSSLAGIGAAPGLAANPASGDPTAGTLVEETLRYAGRYRDAYRFCAALAQRPASTGFDPSTAQLCEGESLYLAAVYDDHSTQTRLADLFTAADLLLGVGSDTARTEAVAPLEGAAALEEGTGQRSQAQADLTQSRDILTSLTENTTGNVDLSPVWEALGDIDLQSGQLQPAISEYDRVIPRSGQPGFASGADTLALEAAYNNRGLVEMAMAKSGPDAAPNCAQDASLCQQARSDFLKAFAGDPENPIFNLNLGWVTRLLGGESCTSGACQGGEAVCGTAVCQTTPQGCAAGSLACPQKVAPKLSPKQQAAVYLTRAVQNDPSLYPAWNDLGVLRVEEGDTRAARHDWEQALAANAHYDLAAWNLGVLDMRAGLSGVIPAQMYLARAIRANSSLRSSELDYKTDERVYSYFVGSGAGNGQALGHDFSVSATALGWLIVLVALFTAVRTVLMDKATEKGVERWEEKFPEAVEEARSRLRKMLRRGKSPESEGEEPPAEAPGEEGEPAGAAGPEAVEAEAAPAPVESETPTEDEQTNSKGWLPWLVTIPPLVVVVAILAHRASPGTEVATAALALAATAVALVTHEVGHMLGARAVKARLKRTYWTPGVPLALAMAFIPLEMNLGPYVGHEVEGEMKETQTWWVYCSGSLGNIAMAVACYGLFLAEPLPLFRLMAQVQLAVCGYSLLPVEKLDGKKLQSRPRFLFALGLLLSLTGAAFLTGLI